VRRFSRADQLEDHSVGPEPANTQLAETNTAAAVAEQSPSVGPEKAPSKKPASTKKRAPKGQQTAGGGKNKTAATAKPKKARPATKTSKAPKAAKPLAAGVREGSKTVTILDLLKRPGGATLLEIVKASGGWQPHSVRGFLSGKVGKKLGLAVILQRPKFR